MLVEEIMNRNVITVKPTDTLRLAVLISTQHRIRHLPVVDNNSALVGIISDRDLRNACPSTLDPDQHEDLYLRPVSEIMHKDIITAHPLDFVEEAAYSLYENRIGCLPVVDGQQLKGIITETDILYTLVELMGVNYPSSHIEIEVPDRVGILADVANVFKENHLKVNSVLVFPNKNFGTKNLVFRAQTIDPRKLTTDLDKNGFKVVWPKAPGENT